MILFWSRASGVRRIFKPPRLLVHVAMIATRDFRRQARALDDVGRPYRIHLKSRRDTELHLEETFHEPTEARSWSRSEHESESTRNRAFVSARTKGGAGSTPRSSRNGWSRNSKAMVVAGRSRKILGKKLVSIRRKPSGRHGTDPDVRTLGDADETGLLPCIASEESR